MQAKDSYLKYKSPSLKQKKSPTQQRLSKAAQQHGSALVSDKQAVRQQLDYKPNLVITMTYLRGRRRQNPSQLP